MEGSGVMKVKQEEVGGRFPIWFSSIDWQRLADPLNPLAPVDYAQAQIITVRAVDYVGENELGRFISRCAVDCSNLKGEKEERIFRVQPLLTDSDPKSKVWAIELYQDHMILRLVERKAPWKRDETVEIYWNKDGYVHLELIMRAGTNLMDVTRVLALIQCSDASPLQWKTILMEYTDGLGYRVDTYYPRADGYKWIDPTAFAHMKTPIDLSFAWKM